MLNLDPGKVLVVLLVALVVLGPDKLPRAARQAGAAWHQLRRWRARLEEEVRGSFPDLPAADTLTEVVRSPLRFLDRLADEHDAGATAQPTEHGAQLVEERRDGPAPAGAPRQPTEAVRPSSLLPAGDPTLN